MNADCGEDLRRTLGLVGFDAHFVGGHFLMEFLPQDGDDIEGGATGQAPKHGRKFLRDSVDVTGAYVFLVVPVDLGH